MGVRKLLKKYRAYEKKELARRKQRKKLRVFASKGLKKSKLQLKKKTRKFSPRGYLGAVGMKTKYRF